jgi:hypothetical protein
MNSHQIRAIRKSFERDTIYLKGTVYNNNLIDSPLMGRSIEDIVIIGNKPKKSDIRKQYTITKWGKVFVLYCIHYNHTSQEMYVITRDDRIIYWISSSIFAPASSAFAILTMVFHGYKEEISCWRWRSTEPFEAQSHHWDSQRHTLPDWFNTKVYFSEYQLEKFNETGYHFIDRLIDPELDVKALLDKEYYHT